MVLMHEYIDLIFSVKAATISVPEPSGAHPSLWDAHDWGMYQAKLARLNALRDAMKACYSAEEVYNSETDTFSSGDITVPQF